MPIFSKYFSGIFDLLKFRRIPIRELALTGLSSSLTSFDVTFSAKVTIFAPKIVLTKMFVQRFYPIGSCVEVRFVQTKLRKNWLKGIKLADLWSSLVGIGPSCKTLCE